MWLIKASNSERIFSVLLCFLLVKHTPILSQTQLIAPTFRRSSQDHVHCSIVSICLWLSYSFISNAIKRLTTRECTCLNVPSDHPRESDHIKQEIVVGLMYGMHCRGTIGQAVLQFGCGLEVEPGNGAHAVDECSPSDCYPALQVLCVRSVGALRYDWSLASWD